MNRRDFLWQRGGGLGGIALAALLGARRPAGRGPQRRPWPGRAPDGGLHHAPKAKRVVQLFMAGAASHIDLFDYKPELIKRHGQPSDFGEHVEAFQNGLGPWLRPVFDFKPYGSCGKMLGDAVAPLGAVVDDIAFVHNVVGKTGVHSQGTLLQTTGFNRPASPAMGSWVSYGLGRMTDNLPAFVVLPDHRGLASNGTKNWDAAFLPSQHQGTVIYPGSKTPIADLFPDERAAFPTRAGDAAGVDLLEPPEPRARRRPAPATTGSTAGSRATSWPPRCSSPRPRRSTSRASRRRCCGCTASTTASRRSTRRSTRSRRPTYFGRKCLAARRLLERGVRFVQIWSGNDNGFPRRNWDSHEDVKRDHGPLALGMARGTAALIQDLKRRGPARRHAHPLDHRVRPDALAARGARAATTTPTASPTGWPAAASRGASATARATSSATSRSTARTPPRSTTSTPRSCTCWASTTPG